MFAKLWHQIREHKVVVFLIIGGIVFLYFLRGGSTSAASDGANAGDGTVQAAQAQAQTELAGINAQSQAAQAQTAAQAHTAELAYKMQSDANSLNANIMSTQLADSLQYLSQHDTLQAQVANHTIDTAAQVAQINATATTQNNRVIANAMMHQASAQAQAAQSIAKSQSCSIFNPSCW